MNNVTVIPVVQGTKKKKRVAIYADKESGKIKNAPRFKK